VRGQRLGACARGPRLDRCPPMRPSLPSLSWLCRRAASVPVNGATWHGVLSCNELRARDEAHISCAVTHDSCVLRRCSVKWYRRPWWPLPLATVACLYPVRAYSKARGHVAYVFYFWRILTYTLTYSVLAYVNKNRIRCKYNTAAELNQQQRR